MPIEKNFSVNISEEELEKIIGKKSLQKSKVFASKMGNKIKPVLVYEKIPFRVKRGGVFLDVNNILSGEALFSKTRNSDFLFIFAATIGEEFDKTLLEEREKSLYNSFLIDSIGSIAIRNIVNQFYEKAGKDYKKNNYEVSCLCFPGREGFPIEEQAKIFSFLEPGRIGMNLSPSYVIKPLKSVTAVFAVGKELAKEAHVSGCRVCDRIRCSFRKEEYKYSVK